MLGGELFSVARARGLPWRSYRTERGPHNKPQLIQAILASQAGMDVGTIEELVIAPLRSGEGVDVGGDVGGEEGFFEEEEERPPPPAQ